MQLLVKIAVTPLAGVWIEIDVEMFMEFLGGESLPLRECGLKYHIIHQNQNQTGVTPLAGVWIEISSGGYI